MRSQKSPSNTAVVYTGAFLIILAGLAIGGWVNNLFILVSSFDTLPITETLVRGIGVFFAPLGAIMGYV